MPKLVNQATNEERQLVKPVTLIGRAEYCDICVRDRIVSREHARITRRLTGYYIEDLGATHGTRVNNVRIHRRAKLHDGDVITIGLVRGDGRATVPARPIHTDTTVNAHDAPPFDFGPLVPDGATCGATFVFRR